MKVRIPAYFALLLSSSLFLSCKQREEGENAAVSNATQSSCPQFAACPPNAAELTKQKGLFAQVSTLEGRSDEEVREYFEHICQVHNTQPKTSTNFIHNLVLQDVADEEGRIYKAYREGMPGTAAAYHPTNHKIDIMEPYFKCFDKVFFGTLDPHWKGKGSLYVDGISSESFRWDHINKSTAIMDRLKALYPDLPFHWYLTFEANLNYLYIPAVKEGYKALFKELTERMAKRRLGHTLWSPTFWSLYRKLPAAEKTRLGAQIVEVFKAAPHIDMIHFQDFLGATSMNKEEDQVRTSDAIGYYRLLANLPTKPAHIGINIEHYLVKCATCAPEAPPVNVMTSREEEYLKAGVPIGTSWEIRFWRHAHKD